jgi:hypothetical protein
VSEGAPGLNTRDATRDEMRIDQVRRFSAQRSREYRRRRNMDLMVRTVRITQRTVSRLVALGYLERGGDKRAEGIAIEAYLGDSL